MRIRPLALLISSLALALASQGHVATALAFTREGQLQHGGLTRTYTVHVPAAHDARIPAPLVLVLHGGGGTGRSTARATGFSELADRRAFVAVYPDAVERHWNDGRGTPARPGVDDAAFLAALVEHLARTVAVDPRRVYATGISNGAMMSFRLACERAEVFAAVAPVAGAMPEPLAPRCTPSRPVPVVTVSGTDDPLVLWGGGPVARTRGRTLSVRDSVVLWARLNGCPTTPQAVWEPDRDPEDGTRVRRETYAPCREGSEVVLYMVEGGGHSWPGSPRTGLPGTGRVSRDIHATEVIWAFFERHSR